MSISINDHEVNAIHFTGILGSGMSALAQFLVWQGITVTGSDRSLNKPETALLQDKLREAGCSLFEQDGSAIAVSPKPDALCISSAIEPDNADIAAAQAENIPVVHRSDVLAALVKQHKTIAVAGTSGKSTVTAMIFEFLTACSKSPSLITGAPLKRLERQSYIGNAFYGLSDLLIIEADESDGTLVKYTPHASVILNISKDHKSIDEITALFTTLISNSSVTFGNADDPLVRNLSATTTFSLDDADSTLHPDSYALHGSGGTLTYQGFEYTLPLLGKHNLSNCAAAIAVCLYLECNPEQLSKAVATYEGVSRRFAITKAANGITIIDDFAHNPEKIKAAITAARMISPKLKVVYQPHGFGPTRFLRDEYRKTFSECLALEDELYLLPIYYAGGTADKSISSADLKHDLQGTAFKTHAPKRREDIFSLLKASVAGNDCILVMGARDQSLPLFIGQITDLFTK